MTTPNGRQVPSYAFPLTNVAASLSVVGRACVIRGMAFKEATGAATASFDLIDGNDVSGNAVLPVTLTAGQSFREQYGEAFLVFRTGVFLRVNSGVITGSVWLVDLAKLDLQGLGPVHE